MHFLQIHIDTDGFVGKNIAYNLKFIPDDKLNWRPAPEAKTALEICQEVVNVFDGITKALQTGQSAPVKSENVFATREEAQAELERASQAYAAFLGGLQPSDLEGTIDMPMGPWPRARFASIAVIDAVHHHGQIAYIQTLLGDKDSHFFERGTEQAAMDKLPFGRTGNHSARVIFGAAALGTAG